MKIEDFYKSIKMCNEPAKFSEVESLVDKKKFCEESGSMVMYPGTRLYLEKFKKMGDKGFTMSRNLVAFLFPLLWSFCTGECTFFFFLTIGFYFTVDYFFPKATTISKLLVFAYHLIFSLYANSLYFWNTERRWKKGLTSKPFGELLSLVLLLIFFSLRFGRFHFLTFTIFFTAILLLSMNAEG